MDELIGYCTRFDPEFPRKIVGADESDIKRVEEATGRSLAPEHRAFLARLGRTPHNSLGEFLKDVEYGVEAMLRFYADPRVPIPPGVIYVWTLDFDSEMFLADEERNGARPLVMFSWTVDDETGKFTNEAWSEHVVADSLFQYLYRQAVLRIRSAKLEHRAQFRARNETRSISEAEHREFIARFESVAEKLGFQPVPYVKGKLIFHERADAVLMLFTEKVARDGIYVYAQDSRELAKLCEIVADNLEVVRWS